MTSAAAMTYDSLVTDVQSYAERRDSNFVEQIPRFIMLAENRICSECRGLGFLRFVAFPLVANTFEKPVRWRESVSLSCVVSGETVFLKERSYQYCRAYSPDVSVTGTPVFYANYDYEHFFVVPTPAASYTAELSYYERPEPLSSDNQVNWTTQYAPQLLLYATLLETAPWLKNDQRLALWQQLYESAKAALLNESKRRMQDNSNERTPE